MAPTGENFRKLALLNCLKQVFFKAFKENLDESKNFPIALKKGGRAKARVAPPAAVAPELKKNLIPTN